MSREIRPKSGSIPTPAHIPVPYYFPIVPQRIQIPMPHVEQYAALVAYSKELAVLQSCSSLLGWDQQTYMPKGGAAFRGEQLALLARLAHEQAIHPRYATLLNEVRGEFPEDTPEAANIREWQRAYDRAIKLPEDLVEDLARVTAAAHEAWVEARKANTYSTFQPHLETILKLKREEAAAVRTPEHAHLYDALLDEYEPGASAYELRDLFANLTAAVVPLVKAIGESTRQPDATILTRDYPVDRQKWFAESAASAFGFDFNAGRLDVTPHPFCSTIGPGDCRITTRYNPKFFNEAFFGVLHEAGHGLYEQNLPAEHFGTPLGSYCSLGVHESQSRFWENQIGRSRPFWHGMLPRMKQAFPGTLDDVSLDSFEFAVNAVKPSLIRVEADEATYNLHIAIRFELELALITGDLQAAELPGAWNEKYKAYLGIAPTTDSDGCLQDVHWSFGGIGYFPTYTLGNMLAAQLPRAMPNSDDAVRAGDFAGLKSWLTENVHRHGRRYRANELCTRATGQPLSPQPFVEYLAEKYGRLYGV